MTVTLKDIARAAGVSHPTVSRALRDHPRISAATRQRIQALAQKMGYRPDPALSALVSYRNRKRPPHRYGKMAVLCHQSEEHGLPPHIAENVTGIRARANQLGFDADVFQIQPDLNEQRRLSRILYHRGIRGVIVTPLPWPPDGFDWSQFAVVGIGENAMPLQLNYVSYDHDVAIRETYLQLKSRGYRNIGFMNLQESEERNRHLFVSAYLKCRHLDGLPPAEPFLYSKSSPKPWLRKNRFDAVITYPDFIRDLEGKKAHDPERLGIAGFSTSLTLAAGSEFATYVIDGRRLGATAVDFMQSLIHRNQLGIPEPADQYSILIRGYWKEGTSVRAAPKTG